MKKTLTFASAAFALAFAAMGPALSQDAPPPPPAPPGAEAAPEGAPRMGHPPRPMRMMKPAEIRLDFGAGRKVAIECGAASLSDCIAAATPLIDKVAATEVPRGGWHERMRDKDRPEGKDGKDKPKD